MDLEFTDRYGGHPPSWLRGCLDQCEATGWVPEQNDAGEYDFVECRACHGTGRVGWGTTILRIPRWFWKGLLFIRFAVRADVNPPNWSLWKRLKLALWCSWGADLQRIRD